MQRKIKVMHMIWSMGDGGAQQIIINYLRDFCNDPDIEFKVYVYTKPTNSKYDKEIAEKGYNVVYLNNPRTRVKIPYIKRFFQNPISKKVWMKAIGDYNPDIVHVHISALLNATMPGIVKYNIPVRFDTLHSSPYRYKGRIKKFICNAFQHQNVIPVCVTETQVEEAKKWYGITKYEIVRNGVDIEQIRKKCCSKHEGRIRFDIEDNSFVIIGVGRLNPIKRFDLLIEVFAKVHQREANSVLIIAGDGEEKDRLIRLAQKLGVESSVKFLGNIVDTTKLYCAADVLAVTSDTESSSLVAIEAQTCGIRCVLSAGVPKESVILNQTQRLQENASVNDWCQALLNNSYKKKSVVNIDDYEVHNMSKRMKDIYLKYFSEYEENRNAKG
ncbi:MAG: glycosyltransferase [Clostridium sp.]|nr:glycosyltransferase [Clostridium sp.]